MRRGWPLLLIFCSLTLPACITDNHARAPVRAACELDALDREKVELQACLDRFEGTQIQRRESNLFITIGCDLLFESDSEQIRSATCPEIDNLAEVLKKYPDTFVKVDVHTDCVRSEEENIALSELRAWVIKKALIDKGMASSRIRALGWGESKPIVSNATEEGRKVNRRVIITLEQPKS